MSVSEKRLLANRLNASKSTGPRTVEGKRASRRNALRHGLTGAGTALPAELEIAVADKTAEYNGSFKPKSTYERDLVKRLALAQVRHEHVAAIEEFRQKRQIRDALQKWDSKRAREVERAAALLWEGIYNVGPNHDFLRGCAEGCDWMAEALDMLEQTLNDGRRWTMAHATLMRSLVRIVDMPAHNGKREADIAFWSAALALVDPSDKELPEQFDRFFGWFGSLQSRSTPPVEQREAVARSQLPDFESAKEAMLDLIAHERAVFDRLAEAHWSERDVPDREQVNLEALVDRSDEGRRLASYRGTLGRELFRTAAELRRHRDKKRGEGMLNEENAVHENVSGTDADLAEAPGRAPVLENEPIAETKRMVEQQVREQIARGVERKNAVGARRAGEIAPPATPIEQPPATPIAFVAASIEHPPAAPVVFVTTPIEQPPAAIG